MKTLCIIPARAGSTRLKEKNWQTLDDTGLNLVHLAAAAAQASGVITRTIVSSDVVDWGVLPVLRRPNELSGPATDLAEVAKHTLLEMERHGEKWDLVVTLQPATPLRSPRLIAEMVEMMGRTRCDSAITCARTVPWWWEVGQGCADNGMVEGYPRSQDVRRTRLQEINTVQIASRETVLRGKRWATPLLITELPPWAVLDIDTPHDLEEARRLWPTLKPEFDRLIGFPVHVVHTINGQELGGAA